MKNLLRIIGLTLFLGPVLLPMLMFAVMANLQYGLFNPFNVLAVLLATMLLGIWIITKVE